MLDLCLALFLKYHIRNSVQPYNKWKVVFWLPPAKIFQVWRYFGEKVRPHKVSINRDLPITIVTFRLGNSFLWQNIYFFSKCNLQPCNCKRMNKLYPILYNFLRRKLHRFRYFWHKLRRNSPYRPQMCEELGFVLEL